MWFVFALFSSIFAVLTSIFAKIGIENVNSNLAIAIRMAVVLKKYRLWNYMIINKKHAFLCGFLKMF